MAGKLKSMFSDSRTRTIMLFVGFLLIVAVAVVIFSFRNELAGPAGGARLTSAPGGIQSVPFATDPTEQYAKLVGEQNVEKAKTARQKGGSAIPTIVQAKEFGEGQTITAGSGVGFSALKTSAQYGGVQKELWSKQLKDSNCSQESVQTVISQGATMRIVREVCSCSQLKTVGYNATQLRPVCSCKELRKSGFSALEMKNSGYSARQLRVCGYDACQMKSAGFTTAQLHDAGYTDGELKGAGFSTDEIRSATGLPKGISEQIVRDAGCSKEALERLRSAGVSAAAVRRISGCTAAQLRAAGYTAKALYQGGYSAAELRNAGFSAAELKQAGYSATDLRNGGFSLNDLKAAGFTDNELQAMCNSLPPGITPNQIQQAGCMVPVITEEREMGICALSIRQYAGCGGSALRSACFADRDLKIAGFQPDEIKDARNGIPAGMTASRIKSEGCDIDNLKKERDNGVGAKAIRDHANCSAAQLAGAGFTAKNLRNAGFSADVIKRAMQGLPEGVTPAMIRQAGCDPVALRKLRAQGVSAGAIRQYADCDAKQLAAAGYDAEDLLKGGYSKQQIEAAGLKFKPKSVFGALRDLQNAGCTLEALRAAKAAGVTAASIRETMGCALELMRQAGFTADDLRRAGYTAAQLKRAGFSAAELRLAGYSADDLKAAGYTAKELKSAGFTAEQMRDAGFDAKALKEAGYSAKDLKQAGYDASALKSAGYSANELKDAGYKASDLKDAGYSADDLKAAGYSAADMRQAGYTSKELKDAGFSAKELTVAGFSPEELRAAGFTPDELQAVLGGSPDFGQQPGQPERKLTEAEVANQRLEKVLAQQAKRMSQQRLEQEIATRKSEMASMISQIESDWAPVEQFYAAGKAPKDTSGSSGNPSTSVTPPGGLAAGQGSQILGPKTHIRAGDISFAVLDTSVNSDEEGPVLATIVSGKLKGARLVGSFTPPASQTQQKIVLTFSQMSLPGVKNSVSINAVAIDPKTARTALASRVDNHYLLRYGSLFAASFMEGFGGAFQAQGTSIVVGGTANADGTAAAGGAANTTTITQANRSLLENAVIGLAKVGQRWGTQIAPLFNRNPTIEIYSGTGMGVLFQNDATVPLPKTDDNV